MSKMFLDNTTEDRFECLLKHKNGFFRRESSARKYTSSKVDVNPFSKQIRSQMDNLIEHVNQRVLKEGGYQEMPLDLYAYYRKVRMLIWALLQGPNVCDVQFRKH